MKKEGHRHKKTLGLMRKLGEPLRAAVGHLQLLYDWARQNAPTGLLDGIDEEDLAHELWWDRPVDELLSLLIASKHVDQCSTCSQRVIHDWWDHCEDSVHMRLAREGRLFANGRMPSLRRFNTEDRPALLDQLHDAQERFSYCEECSDEGCAPGVRTLSALPSPSPKPETSTEHHIGKLLLGGGPIQRLQQPPFNFKAVNARGIIDRHGYTIADLQIFTEFAKLRGAKLMNYLVKKGEIPNLEQERRRQA